MDKKSISTLQN